MMPGPLYSRLQRGLLAGQRARLAQALFSQDGKCDIGQGRKVASRLITASSLTSDRSLYSSSLPPAFSSVHIRLFFARQLRASPAQNSSTRLRVPPPHPLPSHPAPSLLFLLFSSPESKHPKCPFTCSLSAKLMATGLRPSARRAWSL